MDTRYCLNVSAFADVMSENDESFYLVMTSPSLDPKILVCEQRATIVIQNTGKVKVVKSMHAFMFAENDDKKHYTIENGVSSATTDGIIIVYTETGVFYGYSTPHPQ